LSWDAFTLFIRVKVIRIYIPAAGRDPGIVLLVNVNTRSSSPLLLGSGSTCMASRPFFWNSQAPHSFTKVVLEIQMRVKLRNYTDSPIEWGP